MVTLEQFRQEDHGIQEVCLPDGQLVGYLVVLHYAHLSGYQFALA